MSLTQIVPEVDSYGGGSPDTRRTDPITSHEARDSSDATASLGAVLATLREYGPLTDQQLVKSMADEASWGRVPQFTEQRIRTARHALTEMGLVEFAGYYRLTVAGRRAQVFQVVTAEGREAIA